MAILIVAVFPSRLSRYKLDPDLRELVASSYFLADFIELRVEGGRHLADLVPQRMAAFVWLP